MNEQSLAEAASDLIRALLPFQPNERRRIIQAALTLLGDELEGNVEPAQNHERAEGSVSTGAVRTGNVMLRRLGLTMEQLEEFLHFENGEVIPIKLPGNGQSMREQTMNSYLLLGLAAALSSDEGKFSDGEARKLCIQFGCLDAPNHVRILKALGNKMVGSKDSGWKLTSPGLAAAADLVRSGKGS